MKVIGLLLVALLVVAQTKPVFVQKDKLESVEKVKEYVLAFLTGLNINHKLNPSTECIEASNDALNFAAAGLDNFIEKNWYEGTLNITDSLGALSPLSRVCDSAVEQFAFLVRGYPKQFKSVGDFFIKLGLNLLGNVKPLLDRVLFVKNYIEKGDPSQVIQTIGEIIGIELGINKVLKSPLMSDIAEKLYDLTVSDPLNPPQVPVLVWNIFEGAYNLLTSSKFISNDNLVECEGAALNIVLYNMDANAHFQKSKDKEGLLSVFDSFTFLHQMVEGCSDTAIEIGWRSKLIDEEVFNHPSVIWKNTVDNLFFIFSDGFYGYSSNYYSDIVSMMDAVGDFLFRTITYRVEKA
jgi:hypothetical protein